MLSSLANEGLVEYCQDDIAIWMPQRAATARDVMIGGSPVPIGTKIIRGIPHDHTPTDKGVSTPYCDKHESGGAPVKGR